MSDATSRTVVATLSISFNPDTSSSTPSLKLEIDDRPDGLNGGETTFKPGDEPGYFMFVANNTKLLRGPVQTYGSPSGQGSGVKAVDDNILFSNSDLSSLNYPANMGTPSIDWLGTSWRLEGTELIVDRSLPTVDTRTGLVRASDGKRMIGVLNCKYNSRGQLFRASGVPASVKDIMVVAVGQKIPDPKET